MGSTQSISLRPVTSDNLREIVRLSDTLQDGQGHFVDPNDFSLAEACTNVRAWPRGIFAGETAVGFLMLHDDPDKGEYFLWRLMIGGQFQRRGYGRRVVETLAEHVRTRPGAT